jgi:hypothetical protein
MRIALVAHGSDWICGVHHSALRVWRWAMCDQVWEFVFHARRDFGEGQG